MPHTPNSGLDGVVVAQTVMSEVDGEKGRLVIRGYDAENLSQRLSFEQACLLLWSGSWPDKVDSASIAARFAQSRQIAFNHLKLHRRLLTQPNAMDALRTLISTFSGTDENNIDEFMLLTSAICVFIGNWKSLRQDSPLVEPDQKLGHAADLLRMLHGGEEVNQSFVQGLDTYLTTVSDHGMNASTFTARVVASTASDNVSCITAALGALKGPLHGGAPGPVLKMLEEIGAPENAGAWIENELKSGRRIMGMGHRIYRVRDPRAAIFENAITRLESSAAAAPTPRLELARSVEKVAERLLAERHPERPLKANVEFFTAVLLDAIEIPDALFTPTFAAGRVAGWLGHIIEQRAANRLIRPASVYVGGYRD